MEEETQMNSKKPEGRSYFKTQLCRRFIDGTCPHGDKCTYAHGFSDLRRGTHHHHHHHQEPKLCRMFTFNKHCTYGHTCRFLHSTQHHHHHHVGPQAQPQSAGGKNEGNYSAGYRAMQNSTAANASTNTVSSSSLHKDEDPYRVKFTFKENKLHKVNGIYADWI